MRLSDIALLIATPVIPRNACWTLPLFLSCSAIFLALSIGTANPIPIEPFPPAVAIWELIPITLPWLSMRGPPELPGLIAASVWITCSIVKPLGALSWR